MTPTNTPSMGVERGLRDALSVPGNEKSYPAYTLLEFCAARFELLQRGEDVGDHQFIIAELYKAGEKIRALTPKDKTNV